MIRVEKNRVINRFVLAIFLYLVSDEVVKIFNSTIGLTYSPHVLFHRNGSRDDVIGLTVPGETHLGVSRTIVDDSYRFN